MNENQYYTYIQIQFKKFKSLNEFVEVEDNRKVVASSCKSALLFIDDVGGFVNGVSVVDVSVVDIVASVARDTVDESVFESQRQTSRCGIERATVGQSWTRALANKREIARFSLCVRVC